MTAPLIVLVGPTSIGKTRLSLELAQSMNATIVSGDAFQLYRTLDIATAKATPGERGAIPHSLIDVLEPNETISVADYQRMVRTEIDRLRNQHVPVLLVGGSGLYVQSVLFDYQFPGESRNEAFERQYDGYTNAELKDLLKTIDSTRAEAIHENNRRRLLRAIQIASSNASTESTRFLPYYPDAILIGLRTSRERLVDQINRRVDQMVEHGLIEEARRVHDLFQTSQAAAAIGYKELFPYFDGQRSLMECVNDIKLHSRRYAKRQMTWFQNQMDVVWFNVDFEAFFVTIAEVKTFLQQKK